MRRKAQAFYIPFSVFVSFFTLFLIGFLAFFPSQTQSDFRWRKPLTGSVFALVCILGIIAVFFPSECSKIFHKNENKKSSDASIPMSDKFQKSSKIFGLVLTHGHHPECECFLHHEFKVGKKTFCVACMGLFFGALASFLGTATHFFFGWTVGENCLLWIAFGILGVALGLLQYICFDVRWRLVRFCTNAFFVFGMFLLLTGTDEIAQSLLLNLLLIVLCVFWLSTRILLSKRIHRRIYQTCKPAVSHKNTEG
jgi:hypothetical protein